LEARQSSPRAAVPQAAAGIRRPAGRPMGWACPGGGGRGYPA
jgi:hypothetical protein